MDWNVLEYDEFASIATSINYNKEETKAGELYEELKRLQYPIESKVKFILQHWGWDGTPRNEALYIISAINDKGFSIPKHIITFYEQLYGLALPSKKNGGIVADKYGGTLKFKFAESGDVQLGDWLISAECLSAKFDDDTFPIGYRINYNGFSPKQQVTGWENPSYCPCGGWSYELYLGNSGKVYIWDTEVSDYLGVAAENLISFFASAFGLISDTEKSCGRTSDSDFELMEQIEVLMRQGKYKQHYFREKSQYRN